MWPENWRTWQLFSATRTQWRVGFNGPVGLDYTPLFSLMERRGFDGEEWEQAFDDIRAMEAAALRAMRPPKAPGKPS